MLLLIPLLPFLGFLVNNLFGRRLSKGVAGGVACVAILASFVTAAMAWWQLLQLPPGERIVEQTVKHAAANGKIVFSKDVLLVKNADKQMVSIGRRGEISLYSRADEGTPPGAVFVAFCWYEAAVNKLTIAALDPVAKIPEYKVCAVKVEIA